MFPSGAGVSTCLDSERDLASFSLTFLVASPFLFDLDAAAADLFTPVVDSLDLEPDFEPPATVVFGKRGCGVPDALFDADALGTIALLLL
jgi:hypothetical protein